MADKPQCLFEKRPCSHLKVILMQWSMEEISLVGDRDENQDRVMHWRQGDATVGVVADGLGGHTGGALASAFFCEGLRASSLEFLPGVLAASPDDLRAAAGAWVMAAAEAMRASVRAQSATLSPLTTCAVVVVDGATLITLHIGDSRVYRLAADAVQWRSRDHSVVQMLLDDGEITEAEMGTHPEQGRLLRAVGMEGDVRPAVRRHPALGEEEALLLCSDGFWEHVSQEELCSLVSGAGLGLAALAEQAVARAAGKSDNVTAQLLRFDKDNNE